MIRFLLIPLFFLSISLFLSIKFEKSIDKTISLSFLLPVFILYIFGLFGFLKIGVYMVYIFSFFIFVYDIFYLYKIKKRKYFLKKVFLNPGFIIYVFFIIFVIVIQHNNCFSEWDEFSHWGDVIKAMYLNDAFSTNSSLNSAFQSYPPFMSLLQYLYCNIAGQFNEGLAYISYDLFVLSMVIPFVTIVTNKKNKIKKIFEYLVIIGIIFLFPMIFVHNYYNQIYADSLIGFTFGYIILNIYLEKNYDLFFCFNIFLSAIAIILFKDVGLMFALICAVCLIINILLKKNKLSLKKKILIISGMLLSILFAKISWSLNISINKAAVAFSNPIYFNQLIDLILKRDTTYKMQVMITYKHAVLGSNALCGNIFSFSLLELIVIFGVFTLITYKKNKNNSDKKNNLLIFYLGFIIYICGLAVIYCFKFSEYEALRLASWARYMWIYLDALLFFFILLFLNSKNKLKNKMILILAIILLVPLSSIKSIKNQANVSHEARSYFTQAADEVRNLIPIGSKVFYISQASDSYDYWIMKYELRPINLDKKDNNNWSFGEPYYDGDIYTSNWSVDKLKQVLMQYDYVYIYYSNEGLVDKYGSIFENKNDILPKSLYKVDTNLNKLVLVTKQ